MSKRKSSAAKKHLSSPIRLLIYLAYRNTPFFSQEDIPDDIVPKGPHFKYAVERLINLGYVKEDGEDYKLTDEGREAAKQIVEWIESQTSRRIATVEAVYLALAIILYMIYPHFLTLFLLLFSSFRVITYYYTMIKKIIKNAQ